MTTFVLVHGAFRGGYSFARLRRVLAESGHESYAPSLPGAGEHYTEGMTAPSLDDLARCVARLIELEDLRDVVLVGHSQGGVVSCAVSQRVPERLAELVFLDAPVPRHGERAIDLMPEPSSIAPPREAVFAPRPLAATPTMSAEDAAWLNARTSPQHVAPSLDVLRLDDVRALALPRRYLFCRDTPQTYPAAHGRARLEQEGVPYAWLEAGHDAPFTHPRLVASALLAQSA